MAKVKALVVMAAISMFLVSCIELTEEFTFQDNGKIKVAFSWMIPQATLKAMEDLGNATGGQMTTNNNMPENEADLKKDFEKSGIVIEKCEMKKSDKGIEMLVVLVADNLEVLKGLKKEDEKNVQMEGLVIEKKADGNYIFEMNFETMPDPKAQAGDGNEEMMKGVMEIINKFPAPCFSFAITFPKEIVDTNATEKSGCTAKWVFKGWDQKGAEGIKKLYAKTFKEETK